MRPRYQMGGAEFLCHRSRSSWAAAFPGRTGGLNDRALWNVGTIPRKRVAGCENRFPEEIILEIVAGDKL